LAPFRQKLAKGKGNEASLFISARRKRMNFGAHKKWKKKVRLSEEPPDQLIAVPVTFLRPNPKKNMVNGTLCRS